MKKPKTIKKTVTWQIGKGVQAKNPYHPRFFSGNGMHLLKDSRASRWWTVSVRLHFDGLMDSTEVQPKGKIKVGELFDLVVIAFDEFCTEDQINLANNIDALIVIHDQPPKGVFDVL